MRSADNKFLTLREGVQLTTLTDGVIYSLDPHFELFNVKAVVTSCYRSRKDQLELIRKKAIGQQMNLQYPDIDTVDMETVVHVGAFDQPWWLILWSNLLADGVMVNPPEPAKAEFDYIHADGRHIPAGHEVGISTHQLGRAFDVAGAELHLIERVIQHAKTVGIPQLKGYLLEPINGCVHVDCEAI